MGWEERPMRRIYEVAFSALIVGLALTVACAASAQWAGSAWILWLPHRSHNALYRALLVLIACGLPTMLGFTAANLVSRTRALDLPQLDPSSPIRRIPLPESLLALCRSDEWAPARRTLLTEMNRSTAVSANAQLHAQLWGCLGTVVLSMCLIVIKQNDPEGPRAARAASAHAAEAAASPTAGAALSGAMAATAATAAAAAVAVSPSSPLRRRSSVRQRVMRARGCSRARAENSSFARLPPSSRRSS